MMGFFGRKCITLGNALRGVPLLAIVFTISAVGFVRADSDLPPIVKDVRFDQRLNEQVPLDLRFRDELGRWVHLSDYFQGKPVILIMAYYRCPRLCNEVLQGLLKSLKEMSAFDVGDKFQVVTVSFDSRETPDLAAGKKQSAIERYARPGTDDGWHFLTGTQPSIDSLAKADRLQIRLRCGIGAICSCGRASWC